MRKIKIEVYWDPLCLANWDNKGGVGCYKARLGNDHECFAIGRDKIDAVKNLLMKCVNFQWEYVGL